MKSAKLFALLLLLLGLGFSGCEVMPVTRYKPRLHNPLMQMRDVAIVPFYNNTNNSNVDGREFAELFAIEVQRVPGFRVAANRTVEETMAKHDLGLHKLESIDNIRYLAQLLKVDAVVIGKIHSLETDRHPHVKFETQWYHVNPYMMPVLEGQNLPWGTENERYIPDKIVMQAEMNLAEAQLETQTPSYEPIKMEMDNENEDDLNALLELTPPKQAQRVTSGIRQVSETQLTATTIPNNMRKESINEDNMRDWALRQQELALNRSLLDTGVSYIPETPPTTDRKQVEYLFEHSLDHPFKHGPWESETAKENQLPWSSQNHHFPLRQNMQNPGNYVGNYPGFPLQGFSLQGLSPQSGTQSDALSAGHLTEYGWVTQPIEPAQSMYPLMPGMPVEGQYGMVMGEPDRFPSLPADWPDPRGFIPEGPQPERPVGTVKNDGPIISYVAVYNGDDSEFMQALQDYDFLFRDDKRLNSQESILMNRKDFISFCSRMHIWEIFAARGGMDRAEKVTRAWKPWQGGERPY